MAQARRTAPHPNNIIYRADQSADIVTAQVTACSVRGTMEAE